MLQMLMSGLAMGCIYALVAVGFLLIYNATRAANFAQGELVMVGAYMGHTFAEIVGLPLWLAYLAAVLAMGVFGYLFQAVAYYPLRDKPLLIVIVATLAVGMALRYSVQLVWGVLPLGLPPLLNQEPIRILGAGLSPQVPFIVLVTAALLIGLYLFFNRTFLGWQMQAAAQDKDTARLMGISVRWTAALTFVMSSALAGVAGLLLAPLFLITPEMGLPIGVRSFIVVAMGGMGSVPGAITGSLLLGVVEQLAGGYVSSAYKDGVAFLFLLVVLFLRPRGLFGERVSEKV